MSTRDRQKVHPPTRRQVSRKDNFFQRAEVLKRNREKRARNAQFLVEGVAQISLAVKHSWDLAALLVTAGRPLSDWAKGLINSSRTEEIWEVSPELMQELSDKDETSEVMAIIKMRKLVPESIHPHQEGLILVFDRPSSPGNLGSSLRSADAFGANGVIVTGHAVDLYDPFVVRGSMGAVFALPVATAASHLEVADWVTNARAAGVDYQIIGTSGKAEKLLGEISYTRPTVLILGNETVGMSRGYWDICDSVVKIPIGGALSSLNISCAASIMLYEIQRQRVSKA